VRDPLACDNYGPIAISPYSGERGTSTP
jgi:hypothetical protein